MLTALVLLNIVHPGTVMPGKESDLPSRKERKLREQSYSLTPDSVNLEAMDNLVPRGQFVQGSRKQ